MRGRLIAAILWTLLIVAACSVPGEDIPGPNVGGLDKVAHFLLFSVFAVLWLAALEQRPGSALRSVMIGGLLLAGLTELYQGLLPFDREPDVFDALANVVGLAAGSFGFFSWRRGSNRQG